jgi:predicted  nucleic acid-binding Zn-ribbon protein
MLTAPRPDYLATAGERIAGEEIGRLEQALATGGGAAPEETRERISRLRGVLLWNIRTEYDRRLTDAFKDLQSLNEAVDRLQKQYTSFVRTRQAATQSYEGYDDVISRRRAQIAAAEEKVKNLMARQGNVIETMAVNELTRRRERLEQLQITARFAIADSYDRATKAQSEKSIGK